MKTFYKFLSVLIIPSALILYSYSTGSPGGKTGSTGDGGTTCTQCHSGTSIPQANWITTDIPVDGYTAGETYTVTVTGTHTGVVKMGFEVTAENTSGTKKGTWTLTDATRTKFTNGSAAVTHTSAGNVPSGNTNTWSMDWTAPTAGTGDIIFNAAVNAANGNGNNTGDQIYTTSLSVNEAIILNPEITMVSPDHAMQDETVIVEISGSDTQWNEGVNSVMLKFHDDNTLMLAADDIMVVSDVQVNATFNIPIDQEIGLYDIYVDDLMLENAFTVDILDDIADNIEDQINIYPVPADNFINIDLPENTEYRIISLDGRVISGFENSDNSRVDISTLQQGVYFVQIMNSGKYYSKKFIKR